METTEKKVSHTPGPWATNRLYSKVVDATELEICEVSVNADNENFDYEQWRANARLIAAAPELLEALELMVKLLPTVIKKAENYDEYHHALSVIKKARG